MGGSIEERAEAGSMRSEADRAVDHRFGDMSLHDDFTILGGTCVINVMSCMGGSQRVALSRADLEGMLSAMPKLNNK